MEEAGRLSAMNFNFNKRNISQHSFHSHNSSVSNYSFRSSSPIRATRESFDIELVRK
jgi:hypothetical protein